MRPRTELAIGLTALAVLAALIGVLDRQQKRAPSEDPRRSTFLTGPHGARALADALERLHVRVRRYRRPASELATYEPDSTARLLAILDPSTPIRPAEIEHYLDYSASVGGPDLLLAGPGTGRLMRCFGYANQSGDSAQAVRPGAERGDSTPWVDAVLAGSSEIVVTDSSGTMDATVMSCAVPPIASAETLLVTRTGRVEALRLHRADLDRSITLVADGTLFSNRQLRNTDAGPFALSLIAGRYEEVIIDETHHGYQTRGSLAGATLRWSEHSPWGWAVWQLVLLGTVALVMSGVRFGPTRPAVPRERRSPLEHVRALATALAAAKGHDVAVGAIVRGLRRRLSPAVQRSPASTAQWLDSLQNSARSSRARGAAMELKDLTRPGQPSTGVLRAANAVEDVWDELHP